MVISPNHGRETNMAAHAIRAEPYLSLNQPERAPAVAHTVKVRRDGEGGR